MGFVFELRLDRIGALSQPSHTAAVQIIDTSFDLDLTGLDLALQNGAVLHKEVHGVEDIHLHRMHRDLLLFGGTAQLLLRPLGHVVQPLEECTEGVGGLVPGLALVAHVVLRGTVDGTALGVAQDKNELRAKSAGAKLERAHHAALGVNASVAGVAEHEEISRQTIENQLKWHPRVRTAEDGRVWRLANRRQSFPHLRIDSASNGSTHSKALVAFLQELQGCLCRHRRVLGSPDAMGTNERQGVSGVAHGGRELHLRRQELCLLRRGPEEVHLTSLQLIDRTVDFQVSALGQGPNGLAELQEEVDRVEDVHLHRRACDLGGAGCTTHLLGCLACHGSQALKETLKSTARRLGLSSLFDGQVCAGGPGQRSAVGVAHDGNEAAAELANAKLQAAQEASFGMGACVAGISQDEEVARGRVKERLNWGSRVSTANDGSMRSLALVHQSLPHVLSGSWGLGRACDVALVAALEVLQGLLQDHRLVRGGANHGLFGLLGSEQRGRQRGKALLRQRLLLRRGPKELDLACLQLIDTALDLQLATLNLLAEALAVLQQEVDGVEDVHLHGMGCHGLEVGRCTLLTSSHLSDRAQIVQQGFKGGARRTASPQLGIEVALRGAVDGTALGVSQDENQP